MTHNVFPAARSESATDPIERGGATERSGKHRVRVKPTFIRRPRSRADEPTGQKRLVLLTEADLKRARIEMLRDLTGHDVRTDVVMKSTAERRRAMAPFDAFLSASMIRSA
jgi:hypothetical protein